MSQDNAPLPIMPNPFATKKSKPLDETIPGVLEQILRCVFACQFAKDAGMPEHHCVGVCSYAADIQAKALAVPEPTKWSIPTTPDFTNPIELPYATEGLSPEQVEILTVWENTKAQLESLKKFEMECRKAIVYDSGFFDTGKTSGVEHVTLSGGYDLTSTKKENYNLTNKDGETDEALTHFDDTLADMLVSWKPTLSVTAFKKLTFEQQAFFDKALEIKTGAPTLEIKPPKTK